MKIVLTFLICIGLSACTVPTGSPPASLTPPLPATLIPEPLTPTTLPTTPRPSATATATPLPSQTPIFTSLPYLTAVYTKTFKTRQAIFEAKQTEQAYYLTATPFSSFPVSCEEINQPYNLQSPDGNWLAIRCGNNSNQSLEVVSQGGKDWILQFKDFLSKEFVGEDGSTPGGGLYPEHWTGDGKYLYFTARIHISGGGPCFYGEHTDGLYRIKVDDGTVAPQLEPSSGYFYDIAFSPDGRRFAYEGNGAYPAVVDLKTGEMLAIETGNGGVGNLTWSPDGSQLAYGFCQAHQGDTLAEKSSVKVYSVATRTSKTIVEVKQALLRIESQEGDQMLKIARWDDQGWESGYMFFDWYSAQLITATPTP